MNLLRKCRYACVAFVLFGLAACKADNTQVSTNKTPSDNNAAQHLLIFTKVEGDTLVSEASITASAKALSSVLDKNGITSTISNDASLFNDNTLQTYSALVFLNTSGDILNPAQQIAMERYIQAGGGFVGIHGASQTEQDGDWFWYRRLLGASYKQHATIPSNVQQAAVKVVNQSHPATAHISNKISLADQWLEFSHLSPLRNDLLLIDPNTYNRSDFLNEGTSNSPDAYLPISWYQDFDGGQSFYSGLGHREHHYNNPDYVKHILGGIKYAIGDNIRDYRRSRPEPNRFVKEVLLDNLNEPLSLDITQDGSAAIFIERKGKVWWVDLATQTSKEIGDIDVFSAEGFGEFGLVAVALDPSFTSNKHVYLMYNTASPIEGAGPLQRVSRYTLVEGKIDLSTQVTLLDFANTDTCCHTGGNMEFDAKGNLFIATGDNTNPFKSAGVGPADFREGREAHDAYRASANTQDLRGKILRITPNAEGGYTIPAGNLFSDASEGRPEIYVMGTRNPYTIAFDEKEQTLYYGDVGPDSKAANLQRGPKGYDEINKVQQAGNFGWPLFIANNKAYRQYDYATGVSGEWNNPLKPINTSPRNTGLEVLPQAQPAYIWYPYSQSEIFPELGAGSRNALVAGVYRHVAHTDALPEYYEGGLFIGDFMRRWVKVVFSDDTGDIYKIEDFASDAEFAAPIDLKFSHQGQLYVLEYGSKWHTRNADARLSRIVYTGNGNRAPLAKIDTQTRHGLAPLSVELNAKQSTDPDNDPLTYTWKAVALKAQQNPEDADFSGAVIDQATGNTAIFTFANKGKYAIELRVTDGDGLSNATTQVVEVGNAPPQINIAVEGNQSFIWPNENRNYRVSISDNEDGEISQTSEAFERVDIRFAKVGTKTKAQAVGHLAASDPLGPGRALAKKHLCIGCHQEQAQSVGPAFQAIADKYKALDDPIAYLVTSIAAGSTGKWGQHQMPAHDFLAEDIRSSLAQFIMQLKSKEPSLPLNGVLTAGETQASYQLLASYSDTGAEGLSSITEKATYTLASPKIPAAVLKNNKSGASGSKYLGGKDKTIVSSGQRAVLPLGKLDLRDVAGLRVEQKYRHWLPNGAVFTLHQGSPEGITIAKASTQYAASKVDALVYTELSFTEAVNEKDDLYLVISLAEVANDKRTANISAVEFVQAKP
ncbi:ThuA domain-containing protein [Agaribacter flavus]|uniref:Cytochrome c-551 n=1 Tax=Agaribacter flavus TaxID=1902781 RepID=A0ABV7FU54_9ALTE